MAVEKNSKRLVIELSRHAPGTHTPDDRFLYEPLILPIKDPLVINPHLISMNSSSASEDILEEELNLSKLIWSRKWEREWNIIKVGIVKWEEE